MAGGLEVYRKSLRANTRGLWSGSLSFEQFWDAMSSAIHRRLRQAWAEGAAQCGIKPEEFSPEEKLALENVIIAELSFVDNFASDIEAGSKANGGKVQPFLIRVEMWANRYKEVRERAQGMACQNMKAQWIYGDTIEHCRDCSRVVGRIYRLSTWDRYGWIPGSRDLACGGWRCGCQRIPTKERATPGRPPRMLGP